MFEVLACVHGVEDVLSVFDLKIFDTYAAPFDLSSIVIQNRTVGKCADRVLSLQATSLQCPHIIGIGIRLAGFEGSFIYRLVFFSQAGSRS